MRITTTAPVKHDGQVLPIGTTIDLPTADAAELVQAGAATPADGQPLSAPGGAPADQKDALIAELREQLQVAEGALAEAREELAATKAELAKAAKAKK